MTSNGISVLCADGGVLGKNPSPVGGTWAYLLAYTDGRTEVESGVIWRDKMGSDLVTNNQTEMYALLSGLLVVPVDFRGVVMSDSMVSLGRLFLGWQWRNVPPILHGMYRDVRARLLCWDDIMHVLLDGHPTRAQLEAGIGKRGNPVSVYNVICDQLCQKKNKEVMRGAIDVQQSE